MITIKKEVEIWAVRLEVPAENIDNVGDLPKEIIKGDTLTLTFVIPQGIIIDWPANTLEEYTIYGNVCDRGSYYLLDDNYEVISKIEEDYVPYRVIPGENGDYINLKIKNGKIQNMYNRFSFLDFPGIWDND